MRLQGASWFWFTTTLIVGIGVCLSPGTVQAQGTYTYEDTFDSDFAESDSYLHSIFWPQGAFPPSEPYAYYCGPEGDERELGFGDRNGDPAFLAYRFPVRPPQRNRARRGFLKIDVRFPDEAGVASSWPGYLLYRVSADGVEWSEARELEPRPESHEIELESVRGTCHIVFSGTGVLIGNLSVELSPAPATISVPDEYSTIQAAIEASNDGDVIQVASGDYRVEDNQGIRFGGKAITVRSAAGPESTTIDFSGNRGFSFRNLEGPDSVLRGFTIIGGRATDSVIPSDDDDWERHAPYPIGGGIFCELSSPTIVDCVISDCAAELGAGIGIVGGSPAIFDCVIEQCRAGGPGLDQSRGYGAGIGLIRSSDARIFGCTIKNNEAYVDSLGAGLYCWQSNATLVNCDISHNSAAAVNGGGVYCGGADANITLDNCLISNNAAEAGGGVFAEGFESARLTNCTVANNRLSGDAASSAGGIHSNSGDIVIRNSIVWFNDGAAISLADWVAQNPVRFSNIQRGFPGQGNIAADPCFASADIGDYHLKSLTGRYDPGSHQWVDDFIENRPSPCIDAGDPQDPIGAEPFPNRGRINMGAYGGTAEASKSIGPLIFHVDGTNGSDSNLGLSRNNAFKTIGHAVYAAFDGDTILVWPGVYREAITFTSRALTLQSADEAAVITAPNLNDDTSYAFTFRNAESSRMVLRNFVITGCARSALYSESASPTLVNLTVTGNQLGMEAYAADPIITNCIFWNNADGDLFQCRARFSCLQELRGLDVENRNISADPLFVDPGGSDYHLQSEYGRYSVEDTAWVVDSLTSPCIDTGDSAAFIGRERVPHGGTINMGAYGGTPSASLSGRQSWDVLDPVLPSDLLK